MQTTVVKLLDHTCISNNEIWKLFKNFANKFGTGFCLCSFKYKFAYIFNSTFTMYIGYFKFPVKLFRIIQPFFFMYDDWKTYIPNTWIKKKIT